MNLLRLRMVELQVDANRTSLKIYRMRTGFKNKTFNFCWVTILWMRSCMLARRFMTQIPNGELVAG